MSITVNTSEATLILSDGITATLEHVGRRKTRGLKLSYECQGTGFIVVRIPFGQTQPDNFSFDFTVEGESPADTLEVKLVDQSEKNVWWARPAVNLAAGPQRLTQKRRHFVYAWGPDKNPLKEIAYIEFAVAAKAGNKGTLIFSKLSFNELPAPGKLQITRVGSTSGRKTAPTVLLGTHRKDNQVWHSKKYDQYGRSESLKLEFQEGMRELSGLVIDWGKDYATAYKIEARRGRGIWRAVDMVHHANGGRQYHYLPDLEASALRIVMDSRMTVDVNGKGVILAPEVGRDGYEIRSVDIKPYDFAHTYTDFLMHMAKDAPRGHFPRHMLSEQSYWTVIGVDGGLNKSLINEEGMVELDVGTPSIEPFLFDDQAGGSLESTGGKLLTWADGVHSQSLEDGYLPIPTVVRELHGLDLSVTAFADGKFDASTIYLQYKVKNRSAIKRTGKLFLAVRPFQVNPAWQFLNIRGGFAPLNSLKHTDNALHINGKMLAVELTRADKFGAASCRHGNVVPMLSSGDVLERSEIEDKAGTACGAYQYSYELAPNEEKVVTLAVLYRGIGIHRAAERALESVTRAWRERLQHLSIDLPAQPELVNAMRSQLSYILINRQKQAIQPGTRSYKRSWIRDGALTSSALLQQGCFQEVKDFIDWYATFVYDNGKVPCVVDQRGADPFPEHDSHGEFLYLVTEYYRYTGDKELLAKLFPTMHNVCRYIDKLRQERRTPEYKTREKEHLFGLLPESASHEGYLGNPAHSYWDDLFACKGLADASFAAKELGFDAEAQEISALATEFHSDMLCSMNLVMWRRQLDYIPGAADLGDFDSTSTTIGLDPTWALHDNLPAVRRTFNRYWKFFVDRREGRIEWHDYTPYEWRSVGAFLRLGSPDEAHAVMDWFLGHRRPLGWNHWAEVVHRDPLAAKFIGDMPHGWVASDFLRSARSMFAYEMDNLLVVGAGLKKEWVKQGVHVKDMITRFGKLTLTAQELDSKFHYHIDGQLSAPVDLVVPIRAREVRLNGHLQMLSPRPLRLATLPAHVEISF